MRQSNLLTTFLSARRALACASSKSRERSACRHQATRAFAATVEQFVRQFIACETSTSGGRPWERPPNPTTDRLILVVGADCYHPIRVHLRDALDWYRTIPSDQPFDPAGLNARQYRAVDIVLSHARTAFEKTLGTSAPDAEVRRLLSVVYVHAVDVSDGGSDEQEAKCVLRRAILTEPDQAEAAWVSRVTSKQAGPGEWFLGFIEPLPCHCCKPFFGFGVPCP